MNQNVLNETEEVLVVKSFSFIFFFGFSSLIESFSLMNRDYRSQSRTTIAAWLESHRNWHVRAQHWCIKEENNKN